MRRIVARRGAGHEWWQARPRIRAVARVQCAEVRCNGLGIVGPMMLSMYAQLVLILERIASSMVVAGSALIGRVLVADGCHLKYGADLMSLVRPPRWF